MQSYYAARAGEYDSVYQKPERQADLRDIERWLPPVLSGATVLEVACGTGYWTRFIAPVASSVVAVDSAPETLRIAGQRVLASNVAFQVGDAYALRSDGPTFNAAFAGFWFSHVPLERQREFLGGLNAVLQPGAKVVLLDNLFVEGSSSAIADQDGTGNTYQSRKLDDGSTHRVLKNFPTDTQLFALLDSGLGRSAEYIRWRFYWALVYLVPEP
ncbi:MAG TPA: class I SAM-dependent methyltransferase [Caldimonas sp.]|jgi:demethylmenaquinone methyltransferase/2-methoxy-6-polyprenyl-1,4-benzoquinol methylase